MNLFHLEQEMLPILERQWQPKWGETYTYFLACKIEDLEDLLTRLDTQCRDLMGAMQWLFDDNEDAGLTGDERGRLYDSDAYALREFVLAGGHSFRSLEEIEARIAEIEASEAQERSRATTHE